MTTSGGGTLFGDAPPHIYAVVARTYYSLADGNQTVMISGESGSGKTEAAKCIMEYLTAVSGDSSNAQRVDGGGVDIKQKVLDSNPILEAFGNAKTARNDNSSRFGKMLLVQFDETSSIVGCGIDTYLLEKSRVVQHDGSERSYHIFYEMLAGLSGEEKQRRRLDKAPNNFTLLAGECQSISGVDDRDLFEETMRAMGEVGFNERERSECLDILAAILHLGDVELCSEEDESSRFVATDAPAIAAELLQSQKSLLEETICSKSLSIGGSNITKPLTIEEAKASRDALVKGLYGKMFDWIVFRINEFVSVPMPTRSIGILDIFGFEVFEVNSFEQLCINYANERLQSQFVKQAIEADQQEYTKEGIKWQIVEAATNEECLSLIESGMGILSLLDEQCQIPKGSDEALLRKLHETHKPHNKYIIPPRGRQNFEFGVRHYPGDVFYAASGFLDKNKDVFREDLLAIPNDSSCALLRDIFKPRERSMSTLSEVSENPTPRGGAKKKADKSLGSKFKSSLSSLMKTIEATSVHYIRCIKPNALKEPNRFDRLNVVRQLRCSGMIEAAAVRKAGYSVRVPYEDFVSKYTLLLDGRDPTSKAGAGGGGGGGGGDVRRVSESVDYMKQLVARIIERVQTKETMWTEEQKVTANGGKIGNTLAVPTNTFGAANEQSVPDAVDIKFELGKSKVFLDDTSFDCIESWWIDAYEEKIVLIQRTFLASTERKRFLDTKSSVAKVQRVVRGFLVRHRNPLVRLKSIKAMTSAMSSGNIDRANLHSHVTKLAVFNDKECSDLREKGESVVNLMDGCERALEAATESGDEDALASAIENASNLAPHNDVALKNLLQNAMAFLHEQRTTNRVDALLQRTDPYASVAEMKELLQHLASEKASGEDMKRVEDAIQEGIEAEKLSVEIEFAVSARRQSLMESYMTDPRLTRLPHTITTLLKAHHEQLAKEGAVGWALEESLNSKDVGLVRAALEDAKLIIEERASLAALGDGSSGGVGGGSDDLLDLAERAKQFLLEREEENSVVEELASAIDSRDTAVLSAVIEKASMYDEIADDELFERAKKTLSCCVKEDAIRQTLEQGDMEQLASILDTADMDGLDSEVLHRAKEVLRKYKEEKSMLRRVKTFKQTKDVDGMRAVLAEAYVSNMTNVISFVEEALQEVVDAEAAEEEKKRKEQEEHEAKLRKEREEEERRRQDEEKLRKEREEEERQRQDEERNRKEQEEEEEKKRKEQEVEEARLEEERRKKSQQQEDELAATPSRSSVSSDLPPPPTPAATARGPTDPNLPQQSRDLLPPPPTPPAAAIVAKKGGVSARIAALQQSRDRNSSYAGSSSPRDKSSPRGGTESFASIGDLRAKVAAREQQKESRLSAGRSRGTSVGDDAQNKTASGGGDTCAVTTASGARKGRSSSILERQKLLFGGGDAAPPLPSMKPPSIRKPSDDKGSKDAPNNNPAEGSNVDGDPSTAVDAPQNDLQHTTLQRPKVPSKRRPSRKRSSILDGGALPTDLKDVPPPQLPPVAAEIDEVKKEEEEDAKKEEVKEEVKGEEVKKDEVKEEEAKEEAMEEVKKDEVNEEVKKEEVKKEEVKKEEVKKEEVKIEKPLTGVAAMKAKLAAQQREQEEAKKTSPKKNSLEALRERTGLPSGKDLFGTGGPGAAVAGALGGAVGSGDVARPNSVQSLKSKLAFNPAAMSPGARRVVRDKPSGSVASDASASSHVSTQSAPGPSLDHVTTSRPKVTRAKRPPARRNRAQRTELLKDAEGALESKPAVESVVASCSKGTPSKSSPKKEAKKSPQKETKEEKKEREKREKEEKARKAKEEKERKEREKREEKERKEREKREEKERKEQEKLEKARKAKEEREEKLRKAKEEKEAKAAAKLKPKNEDEKEDGKSDKTPTDSPKVKKPTANSTAAARLKRAFVFGRAVSRISRGPSLRAKEEEAELMKKAVDQVKEASIDEQAVTDDRPVPPKPKQPTIGGLDLEGLTSLGGLSAPPARPSSASALPPPPSVVTRASVSSNSSLPVPPLSPSRTSSASSMTLPLPPSREASPCSSRDRTPSPLGRVVDGDVKRQSGANSARSPRPNQLTRQGSSKVKELTKDRDLPPLPATGSASLEDVGLSVATDEESSTRRSVSPSGREAGKGPRAPPVSKVANLQNSLKLNLGGLGGGPPPPRAHPSGKPAGGDGDGEAKGPSLGHTTLQRPKSGGRRAPTRGRTPMSGQLKTPRTDEGGDGVDGEKGAKEEEEEKQTAVVEEATKTGEKEKESATKAGGGGLFGKWFGGKKKEEKKEDKEDKEAAKVSFSDDVENGDNATSKPEIVLSNETATNGKGEGGDENGGVGDDVEWRTEQLLRAPVPSQKRSSSIRIMSGEVLITPDDADGDGESTAGSDDDDDEDSDSASASEEVTESDNGVQSTQTNGISRRNTLDVPQLSSTGRPLSSSKHAPVQKDIGKDDLVLGRVLQENASVTVFMAKDKESGCEYEVRQLHKSAITKGLSPKTVINHSNITQCFGVWETEDDYYRCVDHWTGGSLFEAMSRVGGKLDAFTVQFYIAELVATMEHLHNEGYVHGSLDPKDLLLRFDGHLLVADFTPVVEGTVTTAKERFLPYSAPETFKKLPANRTSDLWTMGCITYHLMAGTSPFEAPKKMTMMKNINTAKFSCPSHFAPEAVDFIQKLLVGDPVGRMTYADIKSHPFFASIVFDELATMAPPPLLLLAGSAKSTTSRGSAISGDGKDGLASPAASGEAYSRLYENFPRMKSTTILQALESTDYNVNEAVAQLQERQADKLGVGRNRAEKPGTVKSVNLTQRIQELDTNTKRARVNTDWVHHLIKNGRWGMFLLPGERILHASKVKPKRKRGAKKEQIIITNLPRLFFVDIATMNKRVEVDIPSIERVEIEDRSSFSITTTDGKLTLMDKSLSPFKWLHSITSLKEQLQGLTKSVIDNTFLPGEKLLESLLVILREDGEGTRKMHLFLTSLPRFFLCQPGEVCTGYEDVDLDNISSVQVTGEHSFELQTGKTKQNYSVQWCSVPAKHVVAIIEMVRKKQQILKEVGGSGSLFPNEKILISGLVTLNSTSDVLLFLTSENRVMRYKPGKGTCRHLLTVTPRTVIEATNETTYRIVTGKTSIDVKDPFKLRSLWESAVTDAIKAVSH